jgi:hypothetical protein
MDHVGMIAHDKIANRNSRRSEIIDPREFANNSERTEGRRDTSVDSLRILVNTDEGGNEKIAANNVGFGAASRPAITIIGDWYHFLL